MTFEQRLADARERNESAKSLYKDVPSQRSARRRGQNQVANVLSAFAVGVSIWSGISSYEAAQATRDQARIAENALREERKSEYFAEYLVVVNELCEAAGSNRVVDIRYGYISELSLGYAAYVPRQIKAFTQQEYAKHNAKIIDILTRLDAAQAKLSVWLTRRENSILIAYTKIFKQMRLTHDSGLRYLDLAALRNESLCYANKAELLRWFRDGDRTKPKFVNLKNIKMLPLFLDKDGNISDELSSIGAKDDRRFFGTVFELFMADKDVFVPRFEEPVIIGGVNNEDRSLRGIFPPARR